LTYLNYAVSHLSHVDTRDQYKLFQILETAEAAFKIYSWQRQFYTRHVRL